MLAVMVMVWGYGYGFSFDGGMVAVLGGCYGLNSICSRKISPRPTLQYFRKEIRGVLSNMAGVFIRRWGCEDRNTRRTPWKMGAEVGVMDLPPGST